MRVVTNNVTARDRRTGGALALTSLNENYNDDDEKEDDTVGLLERVPSVLQHPVRYYSSRDMQPTVPKKPPPPSSIPPTQSLSPISSHSPHFPPVSALPIVSSSPVKRQELRPSALSKSHSESFSTPRGQHTQTPNPAPNPNPNPHKTRFQ